MLYIKTSEQFNKLLEENELVFVDFYAEWCGPCKMMSPIVEQFDEEMKGQIKVCKVNIDENLDLAQAYRITSIPTLALFKNGKLVAVEIGYRSLANLHEMVEKNK